MSTPTPYDLGALPNTQKGIFGRIYDKIMAHKYIALAVVIVIIAILFYVFYWKTEEVVAPPGETLANPTTTMNLQQVSFSGTDAPRNLPNTVIDCGSEMSLADYNKQTIAEAGEAMTAKPMSDAKLCFDSQ